jgi:palmitoyltransferase
MATGSRKAANIWVARIIPLILFGLIGYSAYVITKVVAIDYLINPAQTIPVQPRPGSAAAILLIYYTLLIPLLVCYARLLQTVTTNPGYVPRSAAWYQQRKEEAARARRDGRGYHSRRRPSSPISEKLSRPLRPWPAGNQDPESGGSNHSSLATPKEHKLDQFPGHTQSNDILFWHRSVFICNPDGRPRFCSTCLTPKLDRTHHCSEVDRCVLKMDHFCPWVGGIVSENSFKYFIQFLVYAALFCIVVLTTISVFIAERRRNEGPGFLDVHYFLILGISALFLLFSIGMAGSSIQLALINSTTVENLTRKSKVWFLAVLIPRTEDGKLLPPPPPGVNGPRFQTITYPRPAEEEQFLINQARGQNNTFPLPTSTINSISTPTADPRTFAILSTKPGEDPFDIGPWANIREVMGYTVSEWILPIRQSPCADHGSMISAFKMNGELIRRLKEEAGLVERRKNSRAEDRGGSRRLRSRDNGIEMADVDDASGDGSTSPSAPEDYGARRKKRRRRRTRSHRADDDAVRHERQEF